MIPCFSGAWTQHTDASRELEQDIRAGIEACGSHTAAAIDMEIRLEDLSRQLAGRSALNVWLLSKLPLAFWFGFLAARAKRFGGAFLTPDEVSMVRGAAVMGRRKMLKMLPESAAERKHA